MTEMESGSPKKTPRPRRRKIQPTEQMQNGESLETGMAETQPLKPVIEDVFEETAAARAEFEQSPPSERDMDIESIDASGGSESGPPPGANVDGTGDSGEFVGGDDPNRRRRRRRGRGRGPNGQGDNMGYTSPPPQNQNQNQNQNRQPRGRSGQNDRRPSPHNNQGNQRRPHDGHAPCRFSPFVPPAP